MTSKNQTKLKQIAISEENYFILKKLGFAGESFNDVITEVLKKISSLSQCDPPS